jgi:aminoglycoside phosphotransferase (APT) family kinase protein
MKNLRPLTGGASKEQFVFDLDWTCNGEQRTAERMVIRREPEESVVETSRLREYQLIAAVKDILPVPPVYWLDETGAELTRPTMICGFVTGVQKPPAGTSNVTGVGIQFDEAHRAAIGPQFIEYLAKIHNFSNPTADLSAFDMPRLGTTDDVDWQINWWSRVWREDSLEAVPLFTFAERWLRANRKPLDKISLVHGDFRTGNYLFDATTKKITAILDWELGYFGDRHMDLAWILMEIFSTTDAQGNKFSSSLFDEADFLAEYSRVSGLTVDPERLRYYKVFVAWKGVVHTQATALRVASGAKSHQDVLLSWFSGLSYPLLESLRRTLAVAIDAKA